MGMPGGIRIDRVVSVMTTAHDNDMVDQQRAEAKALPYGPRLRRLSNASSIISDIFKHPDLSEDRLRRKIKQSNERPSPKDLMDFLKNTPPPPTNYMSIPDQFEESSTCSSDEGRWRPLKAFVKKKKKKKKKKSRVRRPHSQPPAFIKLPDTAVAGRTTGGHLHIAILIPQSAYAPPPDARAGSSRMAADTRSARTNLKVLKPVAEAREPVEMLGDMQTSAASEHRRVMGPRPRTADSTTHQGHRRHRRAVSSTDSPFGKRVSIADSIATDGTEPVVVHASTAVAYASPNVVALTCSNANRTSAVSTLVDEPSIGPETIPQRRRSKRQSDLWGPQSLSVTPVLTVASTKPTVPASVVSESGSTETHHTSATVIRDPPNKTTLASANICPPERTSSRRHTARMSLPPLSAFSRSACPSRPRTYTGSGEPTLTRPSLPSRETLREAANEVDRVRADLMQREDAMSRTSSHAELMHRYEALRLAREQDLETRLVSLERNSDAWLRLFDRLNQRLAGMLEEQAWAEPHDPRPSWTRGMSMWEELKRRELMSKNQSRQHHDSRRRHRRQAAAAAGSHRQAEYESESRRQRALEADIDARLRAAVSDRKRRQRRRDRDAHDEDNDDDDDDDDDDVARRLSYIVDLGGYVDDNPAPRVARGSSVPGMETLDPIMRDLMNTSRLSIEIPDEVAPPEEGYTREYEADEDDDDFFEEF